MAYSIKKGDLEPNFQVKLALGATAIDLSTATGVTFVMTLRTASTPTINAPAVILQDGAVDVGWVEYDWAEGDTDTVGIYDAEFRIAWPTGRPQSVPNDDYITIVVLGNLGTGIAQVDGGNASTVFVGQLDGGSA